MSDTVVISTPHPLFRPLPGLALMDAALGALGIDTGGLADALELPSNEAVRAAVAVGGGATLLSGLVIAGSLAAGELVRMSFPATRRRFHLLRHPGRHETASASAFTALAVEPEPFGTSDPTAGNPRRAGK